MIMILSHLLNVQTMKILLTKIYEHYFFNSVWITNSMFNKFNDIHND